MLLGVFSTFRNSGKVVGVVQLKNSVRWATHKATGAVSNFKGKCKGKRRGVKIYPGMVAGLNHILVRQVGTPYRPGDNVVRGRDHTLNATAPGIVEIDWDPLEKRRIVHVRPIGTQVYRPNFLDVSDLPRIF